VAAVLTYLRKWTGRESGAFSHQQAQRFESTFAARLIRADFPDLLTRWQEAMQAGSLWQSSDDQWFQGDRELWDSFVAHVRTRRCLEIGSGPFGYLGPSPWIADRVIIDPLIDFYREEELRVAGSTFFTDDVRTYALPAEQVVQELVGAVDGCIVCRNALDHTDDPLTVLNNIADYALPGCYFLFWTDLWHLGGLDEGHRNITRSAPVMDRLLKGLEFEILKDGATVRSAAEQYIEYGRLARKR
jgi:SAM-dependent methyltransferase